MLYIANANTITITINIVAIVKYIANPKNTEIINNNLLCKDTTKNANNLIVSVKIMLKLIFIMVI